MGDDWFDLRQSGRLPSCRTERLQPCMRQRLQRVQVSEDLRSLRISPSTSHRSSCPSGVVSSYSRRRASPSSTSRSRRTIPFEDTLSLTPGGFRCYDCPASAS